MSYQRPFRSGGNSNNPFGSIMSLLIFVGILALLFFYCTSYSIEMALQRIDETSILLNTAEVPVTV